MLNHKKLAMFLGVFVSGIACGADYFCYLPGANGLTTYMHQTISKVMVQKGVPFIAFNPGNVGDIQSRSQKFLTQFEGLLKKDPKARCHLFGYSMGGLISRWSSNHGMIQGPEGQEPFLNRVLSLTTAASPHLGTPLATIMRKFWSTAAPGVEQLSEENIRPFNDPQAAEFSPPLAGKPNYSYRTYIERKEDSDQPLVLIGFQLIWQDRLQKKLNPLNDGIVPTDHQGFGLILGDLNISHGYFHHETGFKVRLEDFLKSHWDFLTKGTKPLIF